MSEVCKEHSGMVEVLTRIDKRTESIEKTINGNGKMGINTKATLAYEGMVNCKRRKNGLIDWTFRAVLTIIISFIAVKVGLK